MAITSNRTKVGFSAERVDYNTAVDIGYRWPGHGYIATRISDDDSIAEIVTKLRSFADALERPNAPSPASD